nr:MAG TPA: hypothetical protein [Caudoviricetes sp.]
MFTKTMTYTDYNGNERVEDFYFNFTTAEIAEMELSTKGGLEGEIKAITNEMDGAKIVAWFKKIILQSVGKKTPDGKRFVKSKEISEEFAQTEAYSQLFMELAFDAEKGAEFINSIIPTIPDDKEPKISTNVKAIS